MGFFSSKKQQQKPTVQPAATMPKAAETPSSNDVIKTPTGNTSVIKETLKVKADIDGQGSLIIGGIFEGNIKIEDTVFIEKGARFSGTIKARKVKISGDFEGTINSTATEVTKSGRFQGAIHANKSFVDGYVNGTIYSADSVEISSNGIADIQECKSKQIKIVGKVNGKVVASELLEVVNGGSVEGEIITKGIRTEQGGSIIGNIQTYNEALHGENTLPQTDSSEEENLDIDPEVAKLINIKPEDMKKYAKKDEENSVKRISADDKNS